MTLSTLIKKGGVTAAATATPATLATHEQVQQETVAPVATVAVAPAPCTNLSTKDESLIRAWLAHIEETSPEIIAEVLEECRANPDARRYFLARTKEVPEPKTNRRSVSCCDCVHYERIDHPHLGHCIKGEPEAIAGLWDTDRRFCEHFFPKPARFNKGQSRPATAKT